MFVTSRWAIAASAAEVGQRPLARTLLGEPIVLYRDADGTPVALADRCPHRLAPLSLGKVTGEAIECGYHGVRFDRTGRCVHIPGQPLVGNEARVRSYPLRERCGWVWIWMGEPARVHSRDLPAEFERMEAPDRLAQGGYLHLAADYRLLIDNLLDLSHEATLHAATIGNAAVSEITPEVRVEGERVEVTRVMPDCVAPPMFKAAAGFDGNIDRHQRLLFTPPGFVAIEVRALPAGVSAELAQSLEWWVFHAATPETATSTHYFWGLARRFRQDDAALTRMLQAGAERTLGEDKVMLEAQQRVLVTASLESRGIRTIGDVAPAHARRIVARMLAEEARTS